MEKRGALPILIVSLDAPAGPLGRESARAPAVLPQHPVRGIWPQGVQ